MSAQVIVLKTLVPDMVKAQALLPDVHQAALVKKDQRRFMPAQPVIPDIARILRPVLAPRLVLIRRLGNQAIAVRQQVVSSAQLQEQQLTMIQAVRLVPAIIY